MAKFKKTAADGLIHWNKPIKQTAEKQGFAGNGFAKDIMYPVKI